jgi:threonine aldolase
MPFFSDNWAGAHPEILAAMARANDGAAPAYGADALTKRVEARFSDVFERDVAVFFVATGGAANSLALAQLAPPWGMILCHEESHVQMDECGAPEFFTGGAKLLGLKGCAGKLAPGAVAAALAGFPDRAPHGMPPAALSITEATECGTVYSIAEIAALAADARRAGLRVHMDGARFANALVALGCAPADLSWRAGVDALSFGATKNGCVAAEAVIFFDPADAEGFAYRRKRGAQLLSKMRFIAAQFDAYFADGLWLRLAAQANAMARRLSDGLAGIDGCRIWYPVEANEVFASFPGRVADRLRAAGALSGPWITPGDPSAATMHRLVCSWATTSQDVDSFIRAAMESG